MKHKTLILVFIITCVGALLRLYRLGEIPVGLHRDEAFLGYNGYSILRTGKDMSGDVLPVHLRSFLYSPAGYSYATIPTIALFGLNEFSVRLPSALFGTLTVPLAFLLVQSLFRKHKKNITIALACSLFLSISPWHIILSRTATENTISVFFIVLGVYLLYNFFASRKITLLFSAFASFGLSLFFYQAARAFLPLFVPILLYSLYTKKHTLSQKILPIVLFLIVILLPVGAILISPKLSLRLSTVNISSSQETQLVIDEQIREDGVNNVSRLSTRIFHNKPLGYINQFIKNYFSHLTYSFLFTDAGFPDRYRVPNSGLLYILDLPLLLYGSFLLLKKYKQIAFILFSWLGISFIGSALAFDDVPNLQRTLQATPSFYAIIAYGWTEIYIKSGKLYKKLLITFFLTVYSILLVYFLHQYFVHQVQHRPWYRNEGYKLLVNRIHQLTPSYQKIVITTHESAPTIFFLFYNRYDPALFQRETTGKMVKDYDRVSFSKFEFATNDCPLIDKNTIGLKGLSTTLFTGQSNTLYVNSFVCAPSSGARLIDTIKRSDGSAIFQILDTKPPDTLKLK